MRSSNLRKSVQIEGVNLVLGAQEKFNLAKHLIKMQPDDPAAIEVNPIKEVKAFVPGFSSNDRTRAFLKGSRWLRLFLLLLHHSTRTRQVTECNGSRKPFRMAGKALDSGAKEIVLTGVNIGDFGKSTGETFLDLVQELDHAIAVPRMRISSIEPNLLDEAIIDYVSKSERFPATFSHPVAKWIGSHLKIDAPALSDRIYTRNASLAFVKTCHSQASELTSSLAFLGKTKTHFKRHTEFLQGLPISYLHVFTYSEREKTTAVRLERVRSREHSKRAHENIANSFFEKTTRPLRTIPVAIA
jgi:threonylcarbamoyladenosine tRNA methylthiotransferase MtaB